jgi:hypothetical protein
VAGCWSGSTRSTGDRDKWLSCGTWGLTQTGPRRTGGESGDSAVGRWGWAARMNFFVLNFFNLIF